MATKSIYCYRREYDPEFIVGEAYIKDFKPIGIRNTRDYRFPVVNFIYYVPPQFVHTEKDLYGNYSNRIFAVYVVQDDEKMHLTKVVSINIDVFRSYHYGKALKEGDVKVRVYQTADGDMKEAPNVHRFACYNGEFPLTILADGRSYINRPFSFQNIDRSMVWGAKTPLEFYTEDTDIYIKLSSMRFGELQEVDIPSHMNPVAVEEYLIREGGGKPYMSNLSISLKCPADFQGDFFIHKIALSVHFEGCEGLTSISVDDANPNYCAIEGVLFNKNKTKLIKFPRGSKSTSYTIPVGVTEIEDGAFSGCRGLTSIEIPNSVTHIGHYAFCACENLISVTIPNGVTNISQAAFSGCKKLTSIIIPNNVISIGDHAFEGCTCLASVSIGSSVKSVGCQAFSRCSLISVILPDSVKNLGHYAFGNCANLVSVTIGSSIAKIDEDVFSGCTNFSSIHVDDNNPNYSSKDGVLFDKEKQTLVLCPRKKAGSYSIHSNVTSIGDHAFEECADLMSIEIPNGVTNIGQFAFESCRGLTSIDIPDSVTRIGSGAFECCNNITSISIPKSVSTIEDYSFRLCQSITSIIIPSNVKRIGERAFDDCTGLTSIEFPDSVTSIGYGAFGGCRNLRSIIVPRGKKARFLQLGLKEYADIIVERDNEELTIILNLAKAYELGIGVSQNIAQAVLIYTQAAEKGSAEAAYRLAEWYQNGEVLPLDFNKALDLYKQAARSGLSDAEEKVQRIQQKIEENEKPYYLFFDTETAGLPPKGMDDVLVTNPDFWPRLVQIAWILTDKEGNVLNRKSKIIYPNGFSIPASATAIHHITTEHAMQVGEPLRDVLGEFMKDLLQAEKVVGHNVKFDQHIVGAELYSMDMDYKALMNKPSICTKLVSTNFCALPNTNGYSGYKWPSLQELYRKLFNRDFEDAHDALADITATKDCFFELKRRGII